MSAGPVTDELPAFLPPLPDGWRWEAALSGGLEDPLTAQWFAAKGDVDVSVEPDNMLVVETYGNSARVPMLVVYAVLIADARIQQQKAGQT